jgi:hypothetical protein
MRVDFKELDAALKAAIAPLKLDDARRALFRRLARLSARLTLSLQSREELLAIASCNDDIEMLGEILNAAPEWARADLTRMQPIHRARMRGALRRAEILSDPEMLSAEAAGREIGISRQAIDKRRRNGALLALPAGKDYRYPAWQFAGGAALPGLKDVLRTLGDIGPWTTYRFFTSPSFTLGGRTPADTLKSKAALGRVLQAAERFAAGEQGGS